MSVNLKAVLNDSAIDAMLSNPSQRQLVIQASATSTSGAAVPINLSLVLDRSGSMYGEPLRQVREAAKGVIDHLSPSDFISIIAFDHEAETVVPHQAVENKERIKSRIDSIEEQGGTCIDEGMKAGVTELQKAGSRASISRIFVLTDGFNQHGDDEKCLSLAETVRRQDISFLTFGFGEDWNSDLLEKVADAGNGSMFHIEKPGDMVRFFEDGVKRLQAVGALNARLQIFLKNRVGLGELDPVFQVMPDAILQKHERVNQNAMEKWPYGSGGPAVQAYEVRLGSLEADRDRVLTALVYLPQMPQGTQGVADVRIVYDDPPQTNLQTPLREVAASYLTPYAPQPSPDVKPYLDRLNVYKQQRLAEKFAAQGKHRQAATLLQTAGNTLLQGGDKEGATILQEAATKLAGGKELDPSEKIRTKIATKTTLQP